jgi:hypothetical protein
MSGNCAVGTASMVHSGIILIRPTMWRNVPGNPNTMLRPGLAVDLHRQ